MFKKTITYTDFNGDTQTEDLYFNLNHAEVLEMESSVEGGFGENLEKIVKTNNGLEIMKTFKMFILKSYGIKSADGKRFMKSEEISKEFEESPAYAALFAEMCTDANAASTFINNIFPFTPEQRAEFEKKAAAAISGIPSNT